MRRSFRTEDSGLAAPQRNYPLGDTARHRMPTGPRARICISISGGRRRARATEPTAVGTNSLRAAGWECARGGAKLITAPPW